MPLSESSEILSQTLKLTIHASSESFCTSACDLPCVKLLRKQIFHYHTENLKSDVFSRKSNKKNPTFLSDLFTVIEQKSDILNWSKKGMEWAGATGEARERAKGRVKREKEQKEEGKEGEMVILFIFWGYIFRGKMKHRITHW